MNERIEYTGPLTGTLAETAEESESGQLGVPFSPLAKMWEVNPGAKAVEEEQPQADRQH